MSTLQKIGRKIARIRKQRGMTQEELAGQIEMDRSYLSEIENGHKNLSVTVLLKISKALKISPAQLLE